MSKMQHGSILRSSPSEGRRPRYSNAGGRASNDAIRSLAISHKLLGTNEWFVIITLVGAIAGLEIVPKKKARDAITQPGLERLGHESGMRGLLGLRQGDRLSA